jgi:hypothetical protein
LVSGALLFLFSRLVKLLFEYLLNFSSQGIPIGNSRNEKPVAAILTGGSFGQLAFKGSQTPYGPSEISC